MMKLRFAAAFVSFTALTGAAAAQEFEGVDANGDGAITRAEAQQARTALFNRLDANGDGVLSADERNAAAQGAASRSEQRLVRADADNDGVISAAEFMNQPYRGFDRLDANHDGVLSAEEMQGLRARLQRRR